MRLLISKFRVSELCSVYHQIHGTSVQSSSLVCALFLLFIFGEIPPLSPLVLFFTSMQPIVALFFSMLII